MFVVTRREVDEKGATRIRQIKHKLVCCVVLITMFLLIGLVNCVGCEIGREKHMFKRVRIIGAKLQIVERITSCFLECLIMAKPETPPQACLVFVKDSRSNIDVSMSCPSFHTCLH